MLLQKNVIGLFFLCVGFIVSPASAQLEQDLWFNGLVELESGRFIKGQLSYYSDFENGLLQIRADGKTYSFDANQVVRFEFNDPQLQRNRVFYSLPYSPPGLPNDIMLFFEALYEGPYLSVLSKTEIRNQTRSTNNNPFVYRGAYIPSWYGNPRSGNFTVQMPYETLYLVTPKTPITDYNEPTALDKPNVRFRKANTDMLQNLMRDQAPKVQAFLKENRFDLRDRADMLRTVVYYNQIRQELANN